MHARKCRFQHHGDDRGQLVVLEAQKEIPFPVKRVYYMFDTEDGEIRGRHAHKCLEQILICIHGYCTVLLDDGRERKELLLNNPEEGLYIANDIWREMYDFSTDAVLMVLASDIYREEDYIRDYQQFLKMVREEK